MKRESKPCWIRRTHLFAQDEYECSECGAVFTRKPTICPNCGIVIRSISDRKEWLDEAAMYDILDDD